MKRIAYHAWVWVLCIAVCVCAAGFLIGRLSGRRGPCPDGPSRQRRCVRRSRNIVRRRGRAIRRSGYARAADSDGGRAAEPQHGHKGGADAPAAYR